MTILAWSMVLAGILGRWQYDGFDYDGHRYPNPNPDLELIFNFTEDGNSRLHWKRAGESGFCERLATYRLEDDRLLQTVTWVHPDNAPECAQDSDMQLGKETSTVVSISQEEMSFHFDLDGKLFLYILKRLSNSGDDSSAAAVRRFVAGPSEPFPKNFQNSRFGCNADAETIPLQFSSRSGALRPRTRSAADFDDCTPLSPTASEDE